MAVSADKIVGDYPVVGFQEGYSRAFIVLDAISRDGGSIRKVVWKDTNTLVVVDVVVLHQYVGTPLTEDDSMIPVVVDFIIRDDETPASVMRIESIYLVIVDLVSGENPIYVSVAVVAIVEMVDVVVQDVSVDTEVFIIRQVR